MNLVISYFRGEQTFSPNEAPVTIGRSESSHIQVLDSCVSRQHLQANWNTTTVAWELTDTSSTGTYLPTGKKEDHWTIHSSLSLCLAHPEGPRITLSPQTLPANTPAQTSLVPPAQPTVKETLCVRVEDQIYSFTEQTEIIIGRNRSSTVQVGEMHSIVSRNHIKFFRQKNHWFAVDISSRGTYNAEGQLTGQKRITAEEEIFSLGDPTVGLPIVVHTKKSQ